MINITSNDMERRDHALIGLYEVIDPEIGLNIVDLGLIYQIDFNEEEKEVDLLMTLTTQFCPMSDAITGDTTDALMEGFPDWSINVNLTFDPAWDFSKISEAGKEFLGHY